MDPERGRTLEPGRTLGHYRLLERIGAGGMGEVWRAHDQRLERDVALKVLLPGTIADDAARKRFRREALALSKLSHPNIATVFDFDTEDGHDFLVMEYVAGASPGAHRGEGPLPETEVVRLGLQLAEGLAAAHHEGIVHRDLKPANLRLTVDGRLKILDFGLARLAHPAGDAAGSAAPTVSASMTQTGALLGTLGYMAPEQVRGEKVDARADLWAAGLVLYELATGRQGFEDRDTAPLLHAILNQSVVSPRKVNARLSGALEAIILKCVEKDAAKRYASARELATDLQRLQGGLSVAAERSREHSRRLRTLAVAGPGALVLVVVALAAFNVGGLRTRLFAPSPIRSIAVLPLVNLSRDPDQDYFADGMTEELIDELAKVGSLRVISRTSSAAYKGVRKSLPQIARELHVDAVVEGAVSVIGDRVRITAELVQVHPERRLWGDRYEHTLENVLTLQSQLAQAIAQQVRAQVTPEERIRLSSARVVNPAAYEAYLRGRALIPSYDAAVCRAALAEFERSVTIDPTYAPGWAGIAAAYYLLSYMWEPPDKVMPKAREAARRAVELDDQLADGHAALGVVLGQYDRDRREAESEYRRAIALNPSFSYAHFYYGFLLSAMGRFDEAIREFELASRLDPLSRPYALWTAWAYYYKGDYDEAIARYQRLAASDSTDAVPAYGLAWCYLARQMPERAIAALRRPGLDSTSYNIQIARGCALAFVGQRQQAIAIADRLRHPPAGIPVQNYGVARVYASLQDRDRAFEYLEQAFASGDEDLNWLKVDPFMSSLLRGDLRYGAMLKRLGFRS